MTHIPMREQMVQTVTELFHTDQRLALLLAEITRPPFEPLFRQYPHRATNVGIMEQTLISMAAGMALEGFIPVVHTIAPFLIERPFEQLKVDFCYQQLGGNFIGIGGSHDYSTSGMTHHAPGDLLALRSLPGMQVVVPGTAQEFDRLFRASYANLAPTYFRLALQTNIESSPVTFGQLQAVRHGEQATIIAVGPTLDRVLEAVRDLDVTVLYCTTVAPFDRVGLRALCKGDAVMTVEPGYAGALLPDICATFADRPLRYRAHGLTQRVLHQYGSIEQLDRALGLSVESIHRAAYTLLHEVAALS